MNKSMKNVCIISLACAFVTIHTVHLFVDEADLRRVKNKIRYGLFKAKEQIKSKLT